MNLNFDVFRPLKHKPPFSPTTGNYIYFFVFVSVYSITSRNNAPISNFGGGFRCKSEYPWCIIEVKS